MVALTFLLAIYTKLLHRGKEWDCSSRSCRQPLAGCSGFRYFHKKVALYWALWQIKSSLCPRHLVCRENFYSEKICSTELWPPVRLWHSASEPSFALLYRNMKIATQAPQKKERGAGLRVEDRGNWGVTPAAAHPKSHFPDTAPMTVFSRILLLSCGIGENWNLLSFSFWLLYAVLVIELKSYWHGSGTTTAVYDGLDYTLLNESLELIF